MKRYIGILLLAMITYRDFYLPFFTFTDTDMMLNENAYIYAYLQEEVYSELGREERSLEGVVEVGEPSFEPLVEEGLLKEEPQNTDTLHQQKKLYHGLPLFSAKDLKRPSKSKNVGADTNNVGNIMEGKGKGAIGVYKSPNGRYYSVFATVEDGYAALLHEIEIRKATTIPSRIHLSAFLGGWVLGQDGQLDTNSFYYKYALAMVGEDISVLSISTELLAKIIMMGEGTLEAYQKGGRDLRHLIF